MAKTNLTAERLREIFDYNQETGVFTRKANAGNKRNAGRTAGILHNAGYFSLCVNSKKYLAHRLAWLYMTGDWPANDIDHINGIRTDNRFANLRDVTRSVNLQNRRLTKSTSKSHLLGVTFARHKLNNPWTSQIRFNGQTHSLGYFATPELAHAAYVAKKREMHKGCTI